MKHKYVKPQTEGQVVFTTSICQSSNEVQSIYSRDADVTYGGGGSGPARAPQFKGVFDED